MSVTGERPTVGVVIPCFDQARFLAASVASVRAQRYPVECLVVDDGSTDDTAAIATSLGVRLLRQRNAGVSAARNAGLSALSTDLVAFLDADDELLPEAIAMEVEVLAAHRSADAVVGRCLPIDVAGRPLPVRHHPIDPAHLYRNWLSRNFVWTPGAALFRRQALQEIGGFPIDLGPAADYAVYLRLARDARVAFLPRDLVRYRQHAASMSRDPARMLRATLAVLRRERRGAPAWLGEAIRDGQAAWRHWYGEQIVERLSADVRAGRLGAPQVRAALTLLRECPELALRRATGRARRAIGWRTAS
jgi:glycosyltransferase involved in cell wall biosynthesis